MKEPQDPIITRRKGIHEPKWEDIGSWSHEI